MDQELVDAYTGLRNRQSEGFAEVWEDHTRLWGRVQTLEKEVALLSDAANEMLTRIQKLEAWKHRVEKREQEETEGEDPRGEV